MKAGSEYLVAIERLGLRPTALFWALDRTIGQLVLVLTTPIFDYAGPFELSKVLIEAYRKSATPREIDPFIVRTHSPDHAIIMALAKIMPFGIHHADETRVPVENGPTMAIDCNDLKIESTWIYRFEKPAPLKTVEAARRWQRFVGNVDRLAA